MKLLPNVRLAPRWVSYLGCVKGCLDYLDIPVTDGWLYGGTGHAFVMNISADACPSGPTAWNTEMLFTLGRNLGYQTDGVFCLKASPDFAEKQKLAWDKAREAIDAGYPCIGWELEIPEFYVVYGYDEVGYIYSGPQCFEGRGPKSWNELGDSRIGMVELFSIRPGEPAGDRKTVRDALVFALDFASASNRWIDDPYKAGLEGYDAWMESLKTGKAIGIGMAYNAAVWLECREYAVQFLQEAEERLGGPVSSLLEEALEPYRQVSENLQIVADAFPFFDMKPEYLCDKNRVGKALVSLRAARDAEAKGLSRLQKIVDELV